ncbi:hypothetical protein GWE18_14355 [Bradyrhizobium sp. CSA112]|uniref:hypothetical protein n=1 Tax=Bradyrhizobium sp. CSA112 TaxID=2699170 RepID=UPI0023B0B885|nr:hypothetical protein [Bradyrhizobium sp. CSA112]MDE5454029.1 hypothetical protein [Bradyrhizobium sp. CSA112]
MPAASSRLLLFPGLLLDRTPLNFLAPLLFFACFFSAINSPDFLLRLVHAVSPANFVFTWDRFLTAPFLALRASSSFQTGTIINMEQREPAVIQT